MDHCGPHDLVYAPHNVEIFKLLPNCTYLHQPMDAGIIAAPKVGYRSLLLLEMVQMIFSIAELRASAAGKKKGTKGLENGCPTNPPAQRAVPLLLNSSPQNYCNPPFRRALLSPISVVCERWRPWRACADVRGFLPVLHSVKGALGVRTYFIVLAQNTGPEGKPGSVSWFTIVRLI